MRHSWGMTARTAAVLLAAVTWPAAVSADILRVPGEYATIQAAIDAAIDGDIVELDDGTYTGDGNRDLDALGKAITIRSFSGAPESCIINCEFESPGIRFVSGEGADTVLEGLMFTRCSAPAGSGGAVYCEGSSPTLRDCKFYQNFSVTHGGGVYTLNASPTIDSCVFERNWYGDKGGGLYCDGGAPTLTQCVFDGNHAYLTGGAVYCRDSDVQLTDCTLISNGSQFGGAIYCESGALSVHNCDLSSNGADRGGALYVAAGEVSLIACTMIENQGELDGGAIACVNASPTFEDCTITDNRVQFGNAGAVYCDGGSAVFRSCTISRNESGNVGGAVYCVAGSPSFIDCTLEDNVTDGGGGAICCWSGSSPSFENCRLSRNAADAGGAMFCLEAAPTFVNCELSENEANWNGGGVASWGGNPILVNCVIAGNEGWYDGGGVYCVYGDATALVNCLITDNRDGGVYCYKSNPILTNCTVTQNPYYGVYCEDSSPIITSSLFWHNPPEQIIVASGTPAVSYCNVEDGFDGTGNTSDDPQFVDADGPDDDWQTWRDNNYRLQSGSVCVDAADNTALPLDSKDIDNDGDTTELIPIDLDALPRFVDDPHTVDTGQGTPPLADVGAFEYQAAQCAGDVDGDGDSDQSDLGILLASYDLLPNDPSYDPRADLDEDGSVNQADLGILLADYGCMS